MLLLNILIVKVTGWAFRGFITIIVELIIEVYKGVSLAYGKLRSIYFCKAGLAKIFFSNEFYTLYKVYRI